MHEENQSICHGFRCKSGCFHIVWGSVMLSLTQEQFLAFADVINQMYIQLQSEDRRLEITEQVHPDSMLM